MKWYKWVRDDQSSMLIIDVGPMENWDKDLTPKVDILTKVEITEEEARTLYPERFERLKNELV